MKKLYLIRHGHVAFPEGVRLCIGHTDLPLSERGKKQAGDLYEAFKTRDNLRIYASPLIRAQETAAILAGSDRPVETIEALKEMDMGEWENRPLKSIKKTLTSEPVNGEKRRDALLRMQSTIDRILNESDACDVVCVSHAGIISCYLADLLGIPLEISRSFPQPYGGFNVMFVQDRKVRVGDIGIMPKNAPDMSECQDLLDRYGTPQPVQAHAAVVAEAAVAIGKKLNRRLEADVRLLQEPHRLNNIDLSLLQAAARLHDIARTQRNHAAEGAYLLRREGYPEVARIISEHHDLHNPLIIDEAAILFYADKIVHNDKRVGMEVRFSASGSKIFQSNPSKEAVNAYYRRYRHALIIEDRLKKLGVL